MVDLLALSDWLAAVAVDRRAIAEQLYGRTRQPMSNYLMNPKQVPRSEAGSMAMPLGTPGGYCTTEREAGCSNHHVLLLSPPGAGKSC